MTATKHDCLANTSLCENETEAFLACKVCGATFQPPIDVALQHLPDFLVPGVDPMRHKTTADLIEMVRDEIAFFEQDEDSDIRTNHEKRQAEMFIESVSG